MGKYFWLHYEPAKYLGKRSGEKREVPREGVTLERRLEQAGIYMAHKGGECLPNEENSMYNHPMVKARDT